VPEHVDSSECPPRRRFDVFRAGYLHCDTQHVLTRRPRKKKQREEGIRL